jgi:hypothetical protein
MTNQGCRYDMRREEKRCWIWTAFVKIQWNSSASMRWLVAFDGGIFFLGKKNIVELRIKT